MKLPQLLSIRESLASRISVWIVLTVVVIRSHGEGNGNTLQYSCLGNSMNRGAWRATVQGVTKESDMT